MIASDAPSRPRRGGGVERGVAAAVDDDPAAEPQPLLAFHRMQEVHGVEDLRRPAGRDIGAPGDMGADREEGGVVTAFANERPRCRRPWN